MGEQVAIPPELRAAAEAFGGALARAEPVVALKEAQRRLDADEHARALLDRMVEADADLRRRQAEGTLTRADIDRVRDAHLEASMDPSILGFVDAQQAAVAYLPVVNTEISELLGWDFAAIAAAPASC